jgi:CheY-like chemotaxis protein
MYTRRILIVDDAPEFAHLVQDALATMSTRLETTVFLSGEEAWLEALKTRFDLVITDLRLPGISGTELVRRLRSRYPNIKIIAVSGLAEAGLMERTRAAGVDAFYRKPIEIPLLLTQIDNLLAESSPDELVEDRPVQPVRLSKQDTTPVPAVQENTHKPTPADLASMQELEQSLLQLMQESDADGIALSSVTGHVLVGLGSADGYKPDSSLVDTFSMLENIQKRGGPQQTDTSSNGLLVLPGLMRDLIVTSLGKFLFWLLFPVGSYSVESGKAVAAWNASKSDLLRLVNLVASLPMPYRLHPPKKIEERKNAPNRPVVEVVETAKVDTGKLTDKRIPKEEVDTFWASAEPEQKGAGVSSDVISFDQASSLGLFTKDET